MKNIALAFVILVIWSTPSSGEIYNSPFGFSISLPSHWLIVSREEVKNKKDALSQKLSGITKLDKRYIQDVINRVLKGEIECFYNLNTGDEYFGDLIHVNKAHKDLPGLLRECSDLSAELSKAFGRRIEVYECGYKKIGNLFGIFMDYDGVIYGIRTFGIYFVNSRNETIFIGGTCKNQTLKVFRKEFEDIIASFKPLMQ